MVKPCPEVEHGRNEGQVTEGIIKRVDHELMLVLIKHRSQ